MTDPYPEDLFESEPLEPVAPIAPEAVGQKLVQAINRLAAAIENNPVHAAPSVPARPALAPLPPVQTVASTPPCPNHGIEKVKPSTKFPGFYCTAKDPNGPRGYCPWQFRTAA